MGSNNMGSQQQPLWLKLSRKSYELQSFNVYIFDFALLGPQNYERDLSSFVADQLLDFSFSFVVCTDSFIGFTWSSLLVLEAKLGCHMYWDLGSPKSLFRWLFCVIWVLLGGVT